MAKTRRRANNLLYILEILMLLAAALTQQALCNQYKVGDLDAWGIPTSANPHVYTTWPENHNFKIGDSILFLYPPSQDSVIQVTDQSYKTCNLGDPILSMTDGNSLFNITSNGTFYFTSGESGHCDKHQKLRISAGYIVVSDGDETNSTSADASSPSYQPALGTVPSQASAASSLRMSSVFVAAAIAVVLLLCRSQAAGFNLLSKVTPK